MLLENLHTQTRLHHYLMYRIEWELIAQRTAHFYRLFVVKGEVEGYLLCMN